MSLIGRIKQQLKRDVGHLEAHVKKLDQAHPKPGLPGRSQFVRAVKAKVSLAPSPRAPELPAMKSFRVGFAGNGLLPSQRIAPLPHETRGPEVDVGLRPDDRIAPLPHENVGPILDVGLGRKP